MKPSATKAQSQGYVSSRAPRFGSFEVPTVQEVELSRAQKMIAQKSDRIRKTADKIFRDLKELQFDLINVIAALDDLDEAKGQK